MAYCKRTVERAAQSAWSGAPVPVTLGADNELPSGSRLEGGGGPHSGRNEQQLESAVGVLRQLGALGKLQHLGW
jgi:hypothetical protein